MQKNKAKKKRLVTTPNQNQWFLERIMESPQSCAKMKAIVTDYLNNRLLKARHPDIHRLRETENLLLMISVAEELFEDDKIINGKELYEYADDTKKYRPVDDKPKWGTKHKTEFKV